MNIYQFVGDLRYTTVFCKIAVKRLSVKFPGYFDDMLPFLDDVDRQLNQLTNSPAFRQHRQQEIREFLANFDLETLRDKLHEAFNRIEQFLAPHEKDEIVQELQSNPWAAKKLSPFASQNRHSAAGDPFEAFRNSPRVDIGDPFKAFRK